ncbi:hypothetical protein BCR39DRAFT_558922 [Naematelia encephala]|uniref:Uncharacterized protein n=1 Tax=Naematelia encephala TaxID=71784 RepID=A0A1Y2B4Z1_9TREE|nr:hypothetical protein BCR39DRAFT_558922 [Naematelia encephala]
MTSPVATLLSTVSRVLSTVPKTIPSLITRTLAPTANTNATTPLNPTETEPPFSMNCATSTDSPELYQIEIGSYTSADEEHHQMLLSQAFKHTQRTGNTTAVYSVDGDRVTVNTACVSLNLFWPDTEVPLVQTVDLDRRKEFLPMYGGCSIGEAQYADEIGNGDAQHTISVYGLRQKVGSTGSTNRASRLDPFRDLERIKGEGDSV